MNNIKNPQTATAGLCKNAKNSRNDYRTEFALEQQINSIIQGFREYIASHGIVFRGEINPDGKLHRFHIEGHKPGTKNGAYILFADKFPAGWFQDFKSGLSQTWRSTSIGISRVSHDLKKQINKAKRQRDVEMRQKHEIAAGKAIRIWEKTKLITSQSDHAYLARKHIQPHGVRIYYETLTIPIYDESNQLVNLQFINPLGDKRFLSGGRKRGCFCAIGNPTDKVLIAEGFATGASLHEDSGQHVIVAFDAGNLLPVAQNIRKSSPNSEIIICGDNDLSGVGQTKAKEAALAINGKVLIPPTLGTDWNDCIIGGVR